MATEEGSAGALVPAVKADARRIPSLLPPGTETGGDAKRPAGEAREAEAELDRDLACPICMQLIKDAFITACGHSFCYVCIATHLKNKSDCPCCARKLAGNQLFPNLLLDKLLKKVSACQISKTASPAEQFHRALQQGCEVSVKEVDTVMTLLVEKKRKMEQEQTERNMQILLNFLQHLRKQKLAELNEIQADLQHIKEDISAVEQHRMELYHLKEKYSMKLCTSGDNLTTKRWTSLLDKSSGGLSSSSNTSLGRFAADKFYSKKADIKTSTISQGAQRKDTMSGSNSQHISQTGLSMMRKKRIHAQFNDLQECYLQKRRQYANQLQHGVENDMNNNRRKSYNTGLTNFQSVLSSFTRYGRLRVIAELRHGDPFHLANIVSSIEFDQDNELFATAGVSRRIKVFDFSSVVNEPADAHCPVVEMSTMSKLSCLSWNKFTKSQIASSDYEGIVTLWDVTTRQSVMEYEEHEKRAWSVDFSSTEPSMLVSGSDDCKVKVWSTKQETSVLNIDMKANICCVKYNPGSGHHIAVGSADHHIHHYDLRNIRQPVHVFGGHRKAVSYVKFLSTDELASASTDSTLRVWDVKNSQPLRTLRGHTNEKNFVGLSVNGEYIACGSETNQAFVYHKEMTRPVTCHEFSQSSAEDGDEDVGSYFISAVCWKSDSPTLLTANSQGTIKVLVLAA